MNYSLLRSLGRREIGIEHDLWKIETTHYNFAANPIDSLWENRLAPLRYLGSVHSLLRFSV